MSVIGKNIKKIRTVKKISQADFADLFQVSRGSVGSYEEGRAEPRIETIIKIAQYFQLSIDILLIKELTINELYKFDIFKEEYQSREADTLSDKDEVKEDTPLVIQDNYLEYIVNHTNKDYINRLPFVRLPDTRYERTRAFEVSDSAMEYGNAGLSKGDILSCCPVMPKQQASLRTGKVYVVITKNNIFVRRLTDSEPLLVFRADNPDFEALEIRSDELLELWQVVGYYSTILKPPSRLEERLEAVEKKITRLETRLAQ